MEDEEKESRALTPRPRLFLQHHKVSPVSKQKCHLFLSFLCFFCTQHFECTSLCLLIINVMNHIINSLRNTTVSMPLFAGTTSGWWPANRIWFHLSSDTGWSGLAVPFFSYGNNLEGWLAFAPWWLCHSKGSVISVHRLTYSHNTTNNRIQWCWSFPSELFECRAFPETLPFIRHKALPICPAYVQHKHLFSQPKESIIAIHRPKLQHSSAHHKAFSLLLSKKCVWKLTRRCLVLKGLSSLKTWF